MSQARKIAQFLAATAPFVFMYIIALWCFYTLSLMDFEMDAFGLEDILGAIILLFFLAVGFISVALVPTGLGYTLLTFYREQAAKKTTHAYIGWTLSVLFNAFGPGFLFFVGLDTLFSVGFTGLTGFVNFAGFHALTLLLWVTLNFCLSVVALVNTLVRG